VRTWKLAGLVAVLAIFSLIAKPVMARITGTNPTGSSADAWCVGSTGNEVCVDYQGNLIPTTTDDTSLGTSAKEWNAAFIKTVTAGTGGVTSGGDVVAGVGGNLFKVPVATQTVTASGTISATAACGGILRLTPAGANVTSVGFTAPSSANTGCIMYLVNLGGGTIGIATSTTFIAPDLWPNVGGSPGVVLGTNDAIIVGQMGAKWIALSTIVINN
jgi:hypothetical protein